jgi:hypothetical protein
MDSLIMQLQIGIAIPIPMNNSPVFPSGDGKRINNKKQRQDKIYNQYSSTPRTVGKYIFENGKEYNKFFAGPAITKHQPQIPKNK